VAGSPGGPQGAAGGSAEERLMKYVVAGSMLDVKNGGMMEFTICMGCFSTVLRMSGTDGDILQKKHDKWHENLKK
jgi:hypothetical protein